MILSVSMAMVSVYTSDTVHLKINRKLMPHEISANFLKTISRLFTLKTISCYAARATTNMFLIDAPDHQSLTLCTSQISFRYCVKVFLLSWCMRI